MSSTVTEVTVRTIEINTYDGLSTSIGALVVLSAVVLLGAREALRAQDREAAAQRLRSLDMATWPLFGAAGLIILQRLAQLL